MKDPILVNDVLNTEDYASLISAVSDAKRFEYQAGFSRYVVANNNLPLLQEIAEKLIPTAREVFGSDTLLPTYTLFAHYEGQDPAPSLYTSTKTTTHVLILLTCVFIK
jgi:hypothetical protein